MLAVDRRTARVVAHGHEVALHRWSGVPDVVLVHGIGVSHRYFGPLAAHLAHTGRGVLAPDLPGFGGSPRPREPLAIEEHARVLAELLDPSRAVVVLGHSMGAQVATELTVARPDLVRGLVLLGPVTDPAARSAARQGLRLLRDTRRESASGNLLMLRDWLRCGPRWYAATVGPMVGYPLGDRLAQVRRPVTLLRGEHDPVTPRDLLARWAARPAEAVVAEVPGEGHIAMLRRPEEVARWL